MSRPLIAAALMLFAGLLVFGGCMQPVSRVGPSTTENSPTAEPTAFPTATPQPTRRPPTPTPTLVPTPTPTLEPTAVPTASPTPEPDPEFFLQLQEPVFGSTVRTKTVYVVGLTLPGTTVEVDSELVRVDLDGRFQGEITLEPGQNVIQVLASSLRGGQIRDFVIVNYTPPLPPPFFLVVDQPANLVIVADEPIQVAGRTIPQAIVTINGVAVPVNQEGEFSTMVGLKEGVNIIEVLALSTESRTLRSRLSVTYSPP